jgi:hypothetical protein
MPPILIVLVAFWVGWGLLVHSELKAEKAGKAMTEQAATNTVCTK